MSLVGQILLKLIESPTPQVVILFGGFGEICFFKADTCQIFQHEQRILAVFRNECLRNPMIYIGHPTVLSSGKGFESTLCRFCAFGLELLSDFEEPMSFDCNLSPGNKFGVTLFIVTDRQESQATVNPDNMTDVLLLETFNRFGDGNMQIPPAFEFN